MLYYNIIPLKESIVPRFVPYLMAVFMFLANAAAAQDEPLQVYTGIQPVQFLVDRVMGNDAATRVLVRAGQRPETYEPTPRQVGRLAKADVYFGVGMPLESIWRRQLRAATGQGPEWVDLSQSLHGDEPDEADHDNGGSDAHASGHGHSHGDDPHVWLSPLNAKLMVATVSETLGRLRPSAADRYAANARALNRELNALHSDIESILEQSTVKAFLVFHPAWGHFAELYGLKQLAIETEGKEPGPRSFAEVIARAKQAGVRTIFMEPQQSKRMAETVAGALDGRVDLLDPLAYDYIENLRKAARAIAGSGQ